ncbi:MAG TPA: YqcC family protein [Burkholderiales bacterium]|nr:YqcC family protein [Burkholderiales bacterium]
MESGTGSNAGEVVAEVRALSWQEAERRGERLRHSEAATQALAAVESGTSALGAAARDRLVAGLDALALDKGWAGLVVAWLDVWLRASPAQDADALVTHYLHDCLPLSFLASGCPVLDATGPDTPESVPLAIVRQDMTLVLPVEDARRAAWLRAASAALGLENVIVFERRVDDLHVSPHFNEIISRDARPLDDLVEHTHHLLAMGGRWFVLRHTLEGDEARRAAPHGELVQAIELPAPGLTAPLQVLQISARMTATPESAATHVIRVEPTSPPPPAEAAPLGLAEILAAARVAVDEIEAEMKRIGFWTENPPPLLEMADRGELRSYLDAPCFEQWLQCVFLPRARAAIEHDDFPRSSSVAEMARRQYDYHSYFPEAETLLELLRTFDALVERRAAI